MRPEIEQFAEEMEKVMLRHDAEKGDSWKELPIEHLEAGLNNEVDELNLSSDYWGEMQECIDIANYAMMLFHRCRREVEK